MAVSFNVLGLILLIGLVFGGWYFRDYLLKSSGGKYFLMLEKFTYIPRMFMYTEHIIWGVIVLFVLFLILISILLFPQKKVNILRNNDGIIPEILRQWMNCVDVVDETR
jgi:cbb3-type cytochrome oxidase subunit 3